MLLPGAALEQLAALRHFASSLPQEQAGVRLTGVRPLSEWLQPGGPVGRHVQPFGSGLRPARALLFDKSARTNWALDWHQDRTIVVQERVDVPGFGPWTRKAGLQHVAPPFDLLARMVTIRVHLDPVDADNAPLLIAPGSHRLGRVPIDRIGQAVRDSGVHACLAAAGDIWVYSTPILHASARATVPRRRRVLQVDYAAGSLPGGLKWLGV